MRFRTDEFKPEDFLRFIELDGFRDDWRDLELNDEDLLALQLLIMAAPKRHPVISGTGGLRKIRFSPAAWNKGKSGACRVCYVYFEDWQIVLLAVAYSKDEQDDIPVGHRRAYATLIKRIGEQLAKGSVK